MPRFIGTAAPEGTAPLLTILDMRQVCLKLAMEPHAGGTLLDVMEAWVATDAAPAVRVEWNRAREVRRDSPLVGMIGFFLGLDTAGLDAWFAEAAAIDPVLL